MSKAILYLNCNNCDRIKISLALCVPVAQLDRALACGANGCRFDSGQVRIFEMHSWLNWIEHRSSEPTVGGSNPSECALC